MDLTVRDDIFPGLHVRIKTQDNNILEGVVKDVLTMISVDYDGICVKLESNEIGNIIELIQTDSEKINLNLISKLKKDLKLNEGQFLEFKESFAYPTKTKDIQNIQPSKTLKMVVGKTVQAFANAFGGTLYIGVHDKTHEVLGLDMDFSLLHENKKDGDGLEIEIKNTLIGFFDQGSSIFDFVNITVLKYGEKDICVINVKPSRTPFILKDNSIYLFYVRHGNSSEPYTIHKFIDYWPKHLEQITALQSTGQKFLNFLDPFITNFSPLN